MAQIKIRIGAERDRSVDATFGSIERRAARTAVLIGKMLNKGFADGMKGGNARMPGAGGVGGGVRARISAEEKERIASARREDNERIRLAKHRLRLERQEQSFIHKEALRNLRQQEAEKLNGMRRQRREAEKLARTAERERRNFAERTSHRATRFLMPNAPIGSMATRALGDFARGAGVDFSIAGSVARAVGLEKQATAIANQGYVASQRDAQGRPTANATRVDPTALIGQAREVSNQYGLEAGTALDALGAFAGVAGDLALGRSLLADMAKLSAASGTELGDMANAAANVSQQLEGLPNQGELIMEVMKTIAGQGKLGAVEISDMATQMARVAAAAGSFEGDRATNIKEMGALAQLARSTGGAPSAAEAARSVGGFANTLKKSARIDAFKAEGIDVFADSTKTTFKRPMQIIEEALLATGGDLQKLNKMFMDVVGARAMSGLARTFSEKGGGRLGIEAVRAEFNKLIDGATMSNEEIEESARRASETSAAKAARFQNQLDIIVEKASKDLIPALEKAGPSILKFAEMLGNIASWSIENPWKAGGAALLAVTLRGGLESLFRHLVEKIILGSRLPLPGNAVGAPPGTPGAPGGGGGMMGKVSTALGWAGLAVSALTVASLVVDHMVAKEMERERADNDKTKSEGQGILDIFGRVQEGKLDPSKKRGDLGKVGEDFEKGEMSRETLRKLERSGAVESGGTTGRELFDKLESSREANQRELLTNLGAGNKEMAAKLQQIFSGNVSVIVKNPQDFPTAAGPAPNTPQGIVSPPLPGS